MRSRRRKRNGDIRAERQALRGVGVTQALVDDKNDGFHGNTAYCKWYYTAATKDTAATLQDYNIRTKSCKGARYATPSSLGAHVYATVLGLLGRTCVLLKSTLQQGSSFVNKAKCGKTVESSVMSYIEYCNNANSFNSNKPDLL